MDQYETVNVVGRGSFGTAYLCERKSNKQRIVIKRVSIEDMDMHEQEASLTEVRVLALMKHPNVIEYYSSFIGNDMIHIVMEYATGGSLHELLKTRNNVHLKFETAMNFFCQMVLGLEHIHSQKILHRDLKTKNVLLLGCRDPIVKIADFGISKILESKSKASTQLGTHSYWSPELCAGKKYGQASDIWALGCVLYEMLTFTKPFHATNLVAMALKVMLGEFPPIDALMYADCSLPELVRSLLKVDQEKRLTIAGIKAHPCIIPHLSLLYVNLGRIH